MTVVFADTFIREVEKLRDRKLQVAVRNAIQQLREADSLRSLAKVKAMQGASEYFRYRIGDYRIGFKMDG